MTIAIRHLTAGELEAGLEEITRSPKDGGVLEMIVRRPRVGEREILQEGHLDLEDGLVGDSWRLRSGGLTPNLHPPPTLINARGVPPPSPDRSRPRLSRDP